MDEQTNALQDALGASLSDIKIKGVSVEALSEILADEIWAGIRKDAVGNKYVPDQYTLSLEPVSFTQSARSSQEIQNQLRMSLKTALTSTDLMLARDPHFTLATDPTLSAGSVRVIAWHSRDPLHLVDEVVTPVVGDTDKPPTGAFLIIQGKRHYRLKKHLITIGRRLDSDLVLDDQHISRKHAKLLARHGKYVLIDEKSTAGTRVNGQLIDEQTLKPGDVITIAKIDLIYGEGPEGPPDITPPYRPTDKPTDRDQITPLGLKLKYEDDTVALGKKGKKDSTEP
jgi:hypothetical protein